jgi:hypothetical protein
MLTESIHSDGISIRLQGQFGVEAVRGRAAEQGPGGAWVVEDCIHGCIEGRLEHYSCKLGVCRSEFEGQVTPPISCKSPDQSGFILVRAATVPWDRYAGTIKSTLRGMFREAWVYLQCVS